MSRIGMRDSNGEGQSRDGIAILHHHQSQYGYENSFDQVTTNHHHHQQRRRSRRGQPQQRTDEDEEKVKIYACDHEGCPRTFTSNFKLSRHLLIHTGERRFQCTSCDRRFHRKDHLKNHLQVHNPNKILHTCGKCQKTYCSQLSYRKHIALHAAEAGELECRICGMQQPNRDAILCHLKVHTGSRTLRGPSERKYPCKLCDRSFFTKKDVKRHLVVHTGKRDFICKFCPQRFGRKDHLVRHTKKSHNGNGSSPSSNDSIRKYEPPALQMPQNDNHKQLVPSQISDINGLMISQTAISPLMDNTQVMDNTPVLAPIKPDPTYGVPHANLGQSNYSLNSLSNENGQGLGRFPESSLLPVSQYLPMSPSYPGVTPMMSHHYLNMSSSSNILSDLLPPMSMAQSFTTLSLDVGNPPLPHFNQAFQ